MTTILQVNEIKECVAINNELISIIEDAFVTSVGLIFGDTQKETSNGPITKISKKP